MPTIWRDDAILTKWVVVGDSTIEVQTDEAGVEFTVEVPGQRRVVFMPPDAVEADVWAALSDQLMSLAEIRREGRDRVLALVSDFGRRLVSEYPQTEQATWATQESAARDYLASGEGASVGSLAVLDALIAARGHSPSPAGRAERAAVIAAKADEFRAAGLLLAGLRGRAFDDIDQAPDSDEVDSVVDGVRAALAAF